MNWQPSHPDEPALHHELRDAFNARLTNTDFFVWIGVRPVGGRQAFDNLDRIVSGTERWLAGLNPDAISGASQMPQITFNDAAGEVEVRAIPKKTAARGQRAGEIVGNPEPILVGWGP